MISLVNIFHMSYRFHPVHPGKCSRPLKHWLGIDDLTNITPSTNLVYNVAMAYWTIFSISCQFCLEFFVHFFFGPVFCASGTTAKHVVFLAGNTAKHGLRCKACKMSLHHKCEKGVGQQPCMGKLVREWLQNSLISVSNTLDVQGFILARKCRDISTNRDKIRQNMDSNGFLSLAGNMITDVIMKANQTDISELAVWLFSTRMCLFRNHTLCVSVLVHLTAIPVIILIIVISSPCLSVSMLDK